MNEVGLARWLASFSDLRGVVVIRETQQRKWQRILAEYAIARAEHTLACQVLINRPGAAIIDSNSVDSQAEQGARRRLLDLRDQMEQLGAGPWLDSPGATEE